MKHQNMNLAPSIRQCLEIEDMVPLGVMLSKWEKQLWLVFVARPPFPRRAGVLGLRKEDTGSPEIKNTFRSSDFNNLVSP